MLSFDVILMLIAVAGVAGFIDAMAGGGGLLTIPALLIAGVPPAMTLGTNKLQASAGSFFASVAMLKKRVVKTRDIKIAIVCAFIGSVIGTIAVQMTSPEFLTTLIPLLLTVIGIYTLLAPQLGTTEAEPRISEGAWQKAVVPMIGFYDGYAGPGTGMFLALSNVALRGRDMVKATGTAKILNFSTNFASLLFFILGRNVLWQVGLLMMVGQAIGAYLGAHFAIKGGSKLIRPVIVLMCFSMLLKYVFGS